MMTLGDGACGRCLGYEAGALMNGTSALIKEIPQPQSFPAPSTMLGHSKKEETMKQQRSLTHQAGTLISDFPASRTVRIKFPMFIGCLVSSSLL